MSMAMNDITAAAAAIIAARRSGSQFDCAPLHGPGGAEDAYAIQDRVRAEIDPGPVRAWKVGTPSREGEPSAAPIFSAGVLASPAMVPASSFHMRAAEVEVAFRLGRDVVPGCAEADLRAAVESVIVVIELCDTRLRDFDSASAWWKLADNQSNYGLVLGSGTRDWQSIDFIAQRAEFHVNGALRNASAGAHPLGSPFGLLPWLSVHVKARGGALRAGDVITTGSWTGLELVRPGDEILARFPGIGEARATFKM
ncbi:MAG: fumarylacetoacetate hydrolase family protein [Betaproteobacteria bacterium]